ncbi:hypothetical protein ACVLV4_001246 [Rathayibacter agropyri]
MLAGGFLMYTGIGGPIGLGLIGAGLDTIIQKATTGSVNWTQTVLFKTKDTRTKTTKSPCSNG